jgi:glutamate N-acetyltransferase/amino-acid N-acetyltransferase
MISTYTGVTAPQDFLAAGVHCGIKSSDNDLALIYSPEPCVASGMFTTNKFPAAPVIVSKQNLNTTHIIHAIVINSGCANCGTGSQGIEDAKKMTQLVAKKLDISMNNVLVASTGMIGTYLPMDKIEIGINKAVDILASDNGYQAAVAIMTTDTNPKQAEITFEIDGKEAKIGGMAKGAGMICPNMATMLAFLTTDVSIDKKVLDKVLYEAVDNSFNVISVDGDTSTNDMVVILANGASKVNIDTNNLSVFQDMLNKMCLELATMIVKDGEGTTKLIRIHVKNAPDKNIAKKVGLAISNSLLVKCAIFGGNVNWGRILMAIGNADVDIDMNNIDIYLGNIKIVEHSCGVEFDDIETHKILSREEIDLIIDLNQGDNNSMVLGCDITPEYVNFNAHYIT